MSQLAPVLVGVDGSPASLAALRFGAHEAQRLGVGLRLAHVLPDYVPITSMLPLVPADLEATGREILRVATEQARQLVGPENVVASLLSGPRVPALLQGAEHARLVVLGAERRAMLERLLTGSALYGVAARAPCPVVAVPTDWTPTGEHHRVVAGLKSPQHSAELVRSALDLAAERKAGVVFVHAWELPNQYDLITTRVDKDVWTERVRQTIERSLEGVREGYPDVPIEIQVVHGQPARVLQVASGEADVLLLARRHSAFPFGHLGGTGRALLRESRCPVEIVPPADEDTDTSDLVLERAGSLQK